MTEVFQLAMNELPVVSHWLFQVCEWPLQVCQSLLQNKYFAYDFLNKKKLRVTNVAFNYFQNSKGGSKRMLRSIQKTYEIIHNDDPDTAVTLYTIRTWCKEGKSYLSFQF